MDTKNENFPRKRFQAVKTVRTSVHIEAKMAENNEEEEQPLSPMASGFHEGGSGVFIVALIGSETKVDPSFIKENLAHTLLKNPRFSCLQVMDDKIGRLKWVKTCINMDDHVIVSELDPDMKMESAQTFLEDYISNLSKTEMENSKPLWDFHILHHKVFEAESVCILRVHHSLGDGMSLLTLLLASSRKVSDPQALPSFPSKKKLSEKTNCRGFWSYYLIKLWWILGLLWNTMIDIIMAMATVLFLNDTITPLTGSICSGSSSSSRRFVFKNFSLDDVKFIKNATDTTINDVLLAVIQRGLSIYLNRIYGDGKVTNKITEMENNLPKNLRFRASIPVSLRLPRIHAFSGRKEENNLDMKGNNFGYVIIPLTIAIKNDPLDYVRNAKATMERKKHSLEAVATLTIANILLKFVGIKVATHWLNKIPSHTTIVFSNVPGPREEITCLGYPISFMAPTTYGVSNGLTILVSSYVNRISVVLSADESIPNPHQLAADLEESLKLIKDVAISHMKNKFDAVTSA